MKAHKPKHVIYVGPLWLGSTALQRCSAFTRLDGIALTTIDSKEWPRRITLADRVRHRLRIPFDHGDVNGRLITLARMKPTVAVFIDSCRLVKKYTLLKLRKLGVERFAFYSPDDVIARHNSSRQLEACDKMWEVFFTTKTFNVPELRARGVRNPVLVGNSFAPELHRPLRADEVGPDYERFDVVLVGTFERDRLLTINALAAEGFAVVVYGNGWKIRQLDQRVQLRPAALAEDYVRALHAGKIALCPLRKLNRDRITTRSIEIPACCRVMLAEKTDEHDSAFKDGAEYIGYSTDGEACALAREIVNNSARRAAIAEAGWDRVQEYSTDRRAADMCEALFK